MISEACVSQARRFQTLEFTSVNWDTGVTVWLVGADDHVADGERTVNVTFSPEVSDSVVNASAAGVSSSSSSAVQPRGVTVLVVNEDDDVAAVVVDANFDEAVVSEFGPAVTFSISLASEPLYAVVVTCSSSKPRLG